MVSFELVPQVGFKEVVRGDGGELEVHLGGIV